MLVLSNDLVLSKSILIFNGTHLKFFRKIFPKISLVFEVFRNQVYKKSRFQRKMAIFELMWYILETESVFWIHFPNGFSKILIFQNLCLHRHKSCIFDRKFWLYGAKRLLKFPSSSFELRKSYDHFFIYRKNSK